MTDLFPLLVLFVWVSVLIGVPFVLITQPWKRNSPDGDGEHSQ